ncbi:hypothetical protein [Streptomyces sp. KL116D]|uniref:hypothetical protein n=1 Tax=Streptomyces sp. KL116D TaxID=3045152 RepID=UPI0035584A08
MTSPTTQHARPEQPGDVTDPTAAPVLSVRDVHITDRASGREIVHGVSFDLAPGGRSASSASPAAARPSPAAPPWASCPRTSRSRPDPSRSPTPTSPP